MPALTVDIDGVFLAIENNQMRLKGVSVDGDVIDLLDPRDLAPGATGVTIGPSTWWPLPTACISWRRFRMIPSLHPPFIG